eukprot:TRINITY_DN3376_c0_g1_i3.p1 TRINITY_DN3376_c0_g1~~TRINITY_DN3376_c0_g1_i3.p1  ORF type:complete len:227 (-),score=43.90 TRINITY_DN3376_c0_g1_i3:139-819(-)
MSKDNTPTSLGEWEGMQDFFSTFLNPDFPMDIALPMTNPVGSVSQAPQMQAPLMQVALGNASGQAQPMNTTPSRPQPKVVKRGTRRTNTTGTTRKRKANSLEENNSPSPDAIGTLSTEPVHEQEKEKRRQKNRQAAKLFRKRQKKYIEDLEEKVGNLETENTTLTSKVNLLSVENKLVREQLDYMRNFVTTAFQFTVPNDKLKQLHERLGVQGMSKTPESEDIMDL